MSYNFRIGKVLAILTVAAGHFFTHIDGNWVAPTVGLFIFGFSSGYFTSAKYSDDFRLASFWKKKLSRLGPNMLVVHLFLLGLFLVQGKLGIWTWQTLTSLFGVSGFLTWFGLDNPSPFGAGLWFLTLLLIFYGAYPGIRIVGRSPLAMTIITLLSLATCVTLWQYVPMGHVLWLTAWSFVFGVFVQRVNLSVPVLLTGSLAGVFAVLLVVVNVWSSFKGANSLLLIGMSTATVLWLKAAKLPRSLCRPLEPLSGSVLEVYLLHTYLFVRPTGRPALDFLVSVVCVVSLSLLLSHFAGKVRRVRLRRLGASSGTLKMDTIEHPRSMPQLLRGRPIRRKP